MIFSENRYALFRIMLNDSDKGTNTVGAMSRRNILTDILPGSIAAVAGFTTISWSLVPGVAEAAETAQAVMVRPHRHMRSRHRRWGLLVAEGNSLVALGTSCLRLALAAKREPHRPPIMRTEQVPIFEKGPLAKLWI